MQEYLQQSRIGGLADRIGIHFLVFILSMGWFIFLWGLCLPALAAGLALYCLFMMIIKKARDGRLIRREKQLRIRIGGEMALERLLTADPARAHFEIALLLSMTHPLSMLKTTGEGMICTLKGEQLLIALIQCPLSSRITPEHVLLLQRQVRTQRAARGILCAPCAISPEARQQAKGDIPITFLAKEVLIQMLGEANPATDAQLIALGKRKRTRATGKQWLSLILDPRRFFRYALYGALLLTLYFITHLPYYAVTGIICLLLSALTRCYREKKDCL